MLNEDKIIPYHTQNLTGFKVLVLAPHPDDETLGCGGSVCMHTQSGDPVKIVFLTDGSKGDSSGTAEKEEYIALRRGEAEQACTSLGVTDTGSWSYEDRSLYASLESGKPGTDFQHSWQNTGRIWCMCRLLLEIHPDHVLRLFWLKSMPGPVTVISQSGFMKSTSPWFL
ncbi:MAG: PIG-L family deacetylase [Desulfobacterales bacterium]